MYTHNQFHWQEQHVSLAFRSGTGKPADMAPHNAVINARLSFRAGGTTDQFQNYCCCIYRNELIAVPLYTESEYTHY
jgi:hypothetical protein